jgi:hypothetical protein
MKKLLITSIVLLNSIVSKAQKDTAEVLKDKVIFKPCKDCFKKLFISNFVLLKVFPGLYYWSNY